MKKKEIYSTGWPSYSLGAKLVCITFLKCGSQVTQVTIKRLGFRPFPSICYD